MSNQDNRLEPGGQGSTAHPASGTPRSSTATPSHRRAVGQGNPGIAGQRQPRSVRSEARRPGSRGFAEYDHDGDGVQDYFRVERDFDGDGTKEMQERPAFTYGGRIYVDAGAIGEEEIPSLPDVIRTNSEYDVSAITGPINRALGLWRRFTVLGSAVFFFVGLWVGIAWGPTWFGRVTLTEAWAIDGIRDSKRINGGSGSWVDGLKPGEADELVDCVISDKRKREGKD